MRQLIIEKLPDKNGIIKIEAKDYKYLKQVLRVKIGDMVVLRLPDGSLQNSTVVVINEKIKQIALQICSENAKSITRGVQAEQIQNLQNGIEYTLFQFIPKPAKFELIVRQATECGVKNIIPVIGEYSEKASVNAICGNKKERLERIIKEARQQSGSPIDTTVCAPVTLQEAIKSWKENENSIGFVLWEQDSVDDKIRTRLQSGEFKKVAIVVGSEGGISKEEIELLTKENLFYPIHFSVNILRCETAALYGIAAIQTAGI